MNNNEQYTDEDMTNVGRALMDAISAHFPNGYTYNDCPSEIVGDLCNEVDELKYRINWLHGLIAKPKAEWIPTSEGLPEEPGIYLIMMDYQNDLGTVWTMDMASFGDGEWHKAYNVTHWMPLPAKPKSH